MGSISLRPRLIYLSNLYGIAQSGRCPRAELGDRKELIRSKTDVVKTEEIGPPFFERPYYIVPEDEYAEKGYQVIHAALKKEKRRRRKAKIDLIDRIDRFGYSS